MITSAIFTRTRAATFAAMALVASLTPVRAQNLPNGDVHFICGFAAGSGADIIVRFFADKMRPSLNRTIIVENRPGAIGNIATEYVARAKPDGLTVYITSGDALATNMHIFKNPPVDVVKQLQIVTTINRMPMMIAVANNSPYKTMAELTAAMKEKGEKASYSTNNPVFATIQSRQEKIRILAVATGQRLQSAPNYPTMTELGFPMDLVSWWGAMVPMETPRPIVDRLNEAFVAVINSDEGKKFLGSIASDPWLLKPDEAQQYWQKEVDQWKDHVRFAKIEPQG
jgi:tripartite-type tricarboxylate transporter receptor subunit TctC